MLNIRCLKKSQTSLRWVSTKLLQILENLHSRQDKCFTPDILPILLTSYSLVLLFHPSLHSRSYLFFFYLYSSLPWNFLAFLLYSPVLPFYTISSLFFASLCSSFTLHVFKSCVSVSPLTFPYFPLCFLHSPPGGSHFRWVRLWWWPCPKDGHGGTHTHTLYVFVESDIKNVIVLVWAENINHSICNKQCRHTAFIKAYHMIWTPRHLNVDFICFSASQPKLHPGR